MYHHLLLSLATLLQVSHYPLKASHPVFLCLMFPSDFNPSSWMYCSFLPNPSCRTDQSGETLEFTSPEVCLCMSYCFSCMCRQQQPMLQGVIEQRSFSS